MATTIEKTAATVEEALQLALAELNTTEEQVKVEVLERPTKKLFGLLGSKPAKIRVTLKEISQTETVHEVKNITAQAEEKISESAVENITETEVDEENFSKSENLSEVNDAEIIDKAQKFLYDVLKEMQIDAKISVQENDGVIVFDLSGENLGVLIGKHGQTLDALQYLTNLVANRNDSEDKLRFVLDVENYRARRAETLQKLAKSVANRAVRMRQEVRLEPMNRHERRIIHTALQNDDRVETRSAGDEPYRYIIVVPNKHK